MIPGSGNANVMVRHAPAMLLLPLAALAVALIAGCAEDAPPRATLEPALGGARFVQPVEVGAWPDGRTSVAERGGAVWLVDAAGEREPLADLAPIVDAARGEGLLSVALDPSFDETGHVWAYYFAAGEPPRSVLARFEVADGRVDLDSRLVVLELEQPGFNQNGGAIRFDAEGFLYLSLGDGSASTDPFEQGQDVTTLLATVVRLDTREANEAAPYRVPPSNPFAGGEGPPGARPEIYAYGLRNPWRMTVDHDSGEVWLGDVGYSNAEEVNRVEPGANYGWSILEGDRCLDERDCPRDGLTPPVHAYPHEEGRCGVVGGVVYRGEAIPALRGRYLFGDLCSGEIWSLDRDSGEVAPLAALDGMLVTFGVDAAGEVLVADYAGGGVYRLVPAE